MISISEPVARHLLRARPLAVAAICGFIVVAALVVYFGYLDIWQASRNPKHSFSYLFYFYELFFLSTSVASGFVTVNAWLSLRRFANSASSETFEAALLGASNMLKVIYAWFVVIVAAVVIVILTPVY